MKEEKFYKDECGRKVGCKDKNKTMHNSRAHDGTVDVEKNLA